jgi:NADH-quinone oxidoreductase subunit F
MIYAIRQEPDTLFLKGSGIKTSNRNTVVVDPETRVTSEPGVFAGGDVVTGPDTVTEAMGAGKIAAQSIHKYLRGESLARKYEVTRPSVRVKPPEFTDEQMEEILELKRPKVPELPVKERKKGFKEVALGLSEEAAVNEAKRCLRCDLEVETE